MWPHQRARVPPGHPPLGAQPLCGLRRSCGSQPALLRPWTALPLPLPGPVRESGAQALRCGKEGAGLREETFAPREGRAHPGRDCLAPQQGLCGLRDFPNLTENSECWVFTSFPAVPHVFSTNPRSLQGHLSPRARRPLAQALLQLWGFPADCYVQGAGRAGAGTQALCARGRGSLSGAPWGL